MLFTFAKQKEENDEGGRKKNMRFVTVLERNQRFLPS